MKYIPVSQPVIGPAEIANVNEALADAAISGHFGRHLQLFEKDFAEYSGCRHGISVTSGTTALHLALLALSIGPGDEVIVPTLTMMSTIFPVLYLHAKPVPVDIELDTLNMDPALIEERITPRTSAIMVTHLFGHPVDMDPVMDIASRHNLPVIEDAAEAPGGTYKDRMLGGIGDLGCFSFYANKIITTGEGGMLTTNSDHLADRARSLKSLTFGSENKFMHVDTGYNFRMSNIQAAIGAAQLERIEEFIEGKRAIARFYDTHLADVERLQLPVEKPYARNVYWMYHMVLRDAGPDTRKTLMTKLMEKGIESREGFIPYNMQEFYIKKGLVRHDECPRANSVAHAGFYIPSGPFLPQEDLEYVVDTLKQVIKDLP